MYLEPLAVRRELLDERLELAEVRLVVRQPLLQPRQLVPAYINNVWWA